MDRSTRKLPVITLLEGMYTPKIRKMATMMIVWIRLMIAW